MRIITNNFTDKGKVHSYIDQLDDLLGESVNEKLKILEIGVYLGGSVALWDDSFPNSEIHAIDIKLRPKSQLNLYDRPRVNLYEGDAYSKEMISLLQEKGPYDIILDDGPHTLKSMKSFVKNYHSMLNPNGAIMIIEDVQSPEWCDLIKNELPEHLHSYVSIRDLRHIKGRKDDIMFIVDTRKS